MWVTGSFDPDLNLTYWGIGNAGPDYNHEQRPGDNLYTASVVALDADTGKLRWHYQFTPHDHYDYDSVQVPVLADITWQGAPVKAMLWANRNGNFYVLDRATGKFLHAQAIRESELDERLRRERPAHSNPTAGGTADISGDTGRHELVLAVLQSAHEADVRVDVGIQRPYLRRHVPTVYESGRGFGGGVNQTFVPTPGEPTRNIPGAPGLPNLRRGPINNWTDAAGNGAIQAIDPVTGEAKWKFRLFDVIDTGIFTTATRSARHRRTRRLPAGVRRADWHADLENEPRRADAEQPDHLRGERQAVHRRCSGIVVVRVRAAVKSAEADTDDATRSCGRITTKGCDRRRASFDAESESRNSVVFG